MSEVICKVCTSIMVTSGNVKMSCPLIREYVCYKCNLARWVSDEPCETPEEKFRRLNNLDGVEKEF